MLSPGRELTSCVFLELFSGAGHLGAAIARCVCWTVLLWDITLGPQYDLTLFRIRHRISEWVQCGYVCGFHHWEPHVKVFLEPMMHH